MKKSILLLLWIGGVCCWGCGTNGNTNNKAESVEKMADTIPAQIIAGNFSDQRTLKLDSFLITRFLRKYPLFSAFEKDFFRFYGGREFAMAWHDKKGLIEQANILYNRILHMEDNGLNPDVPYPEDYARLMQDNEPDSVKTKELMITGQYLHFARKVLEGLPDQDLHSQQWFIPRKKMDYAALLEQMISGNRSMLEKAVFPQYRKLRNALKLYREIENQGGWPLLQLNGQKSFKLGDTGLLITLLRKRLAMEGYDTEKMTSTTFDLVLERAVRQYQQNHGLTADGIAGGMLIRELNVPVRQRIEQIMVNMERCRWLPNESDEAFMVINIPEFKAYILETDSVVYTSRVIVGKETNKTVIFKGDMKYIVFSPYWNVPESIMKKEILPAIKKNPNYMEINKMEWVDGKIRQKPGEHNALGLVKFIFPNAYHIYLHDTPSKQLFEQEQRTFSHGCIRLSSPRALVGYLLKNQSEWTNSAIDSAMHSGAEKTVSLQKPLPVYIIYLTAFIDPSGQLNFRKDIYERDQELKDRIISK